MPPVNRTLFSFHLLIPALFAGDRLLLRTSLLLRSAAVSAWPLLPAGGDRILRLLAQSGLLVGDWFKSFMSEVVAAAAAVILLVASLCLASAFSRSALSLAAADIPAPPAVPGPELLSPPSSSRGLERRRRRWLISPPPPPPSELKISGK